MAFDGLLGQPTARLTLERALQAGKVHHAYRFEGPPGVGKTLAALLLARALVCPESTWGCGECGACKRALTIATSPPEVPQHPDVVFVGRGLYPSNLIGSSEATGISVEQIRRIVLTRVGFRPHEGQALVFLIHDADELSTSAANALLKTLEEPADRTHFILLTSRPGRLLDTIRSRTLAIRFGPLPEQIVREILVKEGAPAEVAEFAQGSLARARAYVDPEKRDAQQKFADAADRLLNAPHPEAALTFAEERPEARDELLGHLRDLATTYALRGRSASPEQAALWAGRYFEVTRALREIERNGSPALVLESLLLRLQRSA